MNEKGQTGQEGGAKHGDAGANVPTSFTKWAATALKGRVPDRVPDLTVAAGDRATVSYQKASHTFTVIHPRSIDEVKQVLGVPADAVTSGPCEPNAELTASLVGTDALSHPEQGPAAARVARLAAAEYVRGNPQAVSRWKPLIEHWLELSKAEIHIAWFWNIVVEDGGVLVVSADTHALYANAISLFGTGTIRPLGPITIDCVRFQGKI